jgi:hypothetical protein
LAIVKVQFSRSGGTYNVEDDFQHAIIPEVYVEAGQIDWACK